MHLSIDLASFLIIEIIQKKNFSKASRKNLTPSALKTENVFFLNHLKKNPEFEMLNFITKSPLVPAQKPK